VDEIVDRRGELRRIDGEPSRRRIESRAARLDEAVDLKRRPLAVRLGDAEPHAPEKARKVRDEEIWTELLRHLPFFDHVEDVERARDVGLRLFDCRVARAERDANFDLLAVLLREGGPEAVRQLVK
jgi:hypothetical protein